MDMTSSAPRSTRANQKTSATGSTSSGARNRRSATSAATIVRSSSRNRPNVQSLLPKSSRIPIRVFQRAREDGEEDDGESGEDTRRHRAAGVLERERERKRGGRRERAVADERGVAVVLAQDPEQRGGREERDDRADVDESTFARPARPQRVGRQQSLERHVTSCDKRAGRRNPPGALLATSRRRRCRSRSRSPP